MLFIYYKYIIFIINIRVNNNSDDMLKYINRFIFELLIGLERINNYEKYANGGENKGGD